MAAVVIEAASQSIHQEQHDQDDRGQSQQPAGVQAAVWTNPNPPLPRGRAPKDPDAVTKKYDCASLQELEIKLKDYLEHPPAAEEHCTAELTLWAGASFLVNLPTGDRQPSHIRQDAGMLQPVVDALNASTGAVPVTSQSISASSNKVTQVTLSVLDALQPMPDSKDTMKRQRAISKVCVAAVSKVDGFRYSFHNNWKSGEDNAFRFSYYCNDSLLNKDRVANGKAGSQGRRATKPVYDCKGVLSIKFSATKSCIDVVYRHVRCHETYEERAPPPRRDAKRRAEWEMTNPDRVKVPRFIQRPPSVEETPMPPKKKRAKKKQGEPQTTAENDLRMQSLKSLLELIRDDEPEQPIQAVPPVIASVPAPAPPSAPKVAGTAQRTPTQRPGGGSCALCLSRRSRCDGARPKCKCCMDKDWPCFYMAEGPNGEPQIVVHEVLNQSVRSDPMQQSAITALSLASANEDLQRELNQVRRELLDSQKEVYDLRSKNADFEKQLEQLRAENKLRAELRTEHTRLNNGQTSNNQPGANHDRRSNHSQQTVTIPPPPQPPAFHRQHQYPGSGSQMYHGQPAPSQAAHTRAPPYPPNNPPPPSWPGVYGYQQPVQHQQQSAIWPPQQPHMANSLR